MKITKSDLLRRIKALEEWSNGADDMLTELNHALPDPEYDAKCEENAVAVEESLARHAVRLGLKKPELTGSDLCRKMLERGDEAILCRVYDNGNEQIDCYYDAITGCSDVYFDSSLSSWDNAIPINNQGEPLTQSDVGL